MILYLVRHGKAKQSSPTGRDADRPLKPRGERQAARLGDHLASDDSEDHAPRLMLTSGHVRAAETARLIHERVGGEMRHERALELGWPAENVIEVVEKLRLSDETGPVMLVGHNPQMEILVSFLAQDRATEDVEMRTGMAAVIELDSSTNPHCGGRLLKTLRFDD